MWSITVPLPNSIQIDRDDNMSVPIIILLGHARLSLFSRKGILRFGKNQLLINNGVENIANGYSPNNDINNDIKKLHKMIRKYDQKELTIVPVYLIFVFYTFDFHRHFFVSFWILYIVVG